MERAAANDAAEPVSKLNRFQPLDCASATIRDRTAWPTPWRKNFSLVLIDLTSPCLWSSLWSAPHPQSTEPTHAVQKVTWSCWSLCKGNAWTLSRGVFWSIPAMCSRTIDWDSTLERSSWRTTMFMGLTGSHLSQIELSQGEPARLPMPATSPQHCAGEVPFLRPLGLEKNRFAAPLHA